VAEAFEGTERDPALGKDVVYLLLFWEEIGVGAYDEAVPVRAGH
jgi:hypothetical protein